MEDPYAGWIMWYVWPDLQIPGTIPHISKIEIFVSHVRMVF